MKGAQKRPKHIPERTCIVCRRKGPKWGLVRVVRTPQGALEIDNGRGKKAGRGAYLCRAQKCWEKGFKKKRLEHALKAEISAEQLAELLEYGNTLPVINESVTDCSGEQMGEGGCG